MRVFLIIIFLANFLFASSVSNLELLQTKSKSIFVVNLYKQHHNYQIEIKNNDTSKEVFIYKNSIKIKINKESIDNKYISFIEKSIIIHQQTAFKNAVHIQIPFQKINTLSVTFQSCNQHICYPPITFVFKINKNIQNNTSLTNLDTNSITDILKEKSFIQILGIFFIIGLLLSLTPCVFPMIPILASLLKNIASKKRMFLISFIYVLSSSLTYAILGIISSFLGSNIQGYFQNSIVIIIFALFFIILALSAFGLFKLELQNLAVKPSDLSVGI